MSGFAGALRERVTIWRRAEARDALGGASGTWTAGASVWAAVRPGGREPPVEAEARSAAPRWRVTLRAGAGARVGDRIGWRGRWLLVAGLVEDPATPDRVMLETEEERPCAE